MDQDLISSADLRKLESLVELHEQATVQLRKFLENLKQKRKSTSAVSLSQPNRVTSQE